MIILLLLSALLVVYYFTGSSLAAIVLGAICFAGYFLLEPFLRRPSITPTPAKPVAAAAATTVEALTPVKIMRHNMKAKSLLLGQADDGTQAYWDFTGAQQLGLFGANGSGKSVSVAANIIMSFILRGWHVIILDPKRGADYSHFRSFSEYHYSGPDEMPEQLEWVEMEVARRAKLLQEYEVGHVDQLPAKVKPRDMALVVEELGETRLALAASSPSRLANMDVTLGRLFSKSRYTGLRIILIDQRPNDYHKAVKGNLKEVIGFRLGMHQGAGIAMPATEKLPLFGAFMMSSNYGPVFKSCNFELYAKELMQRALQVINAQKLASTARYFYLYALSGEICDYIIGEQAPKLQTAPSSNEQVDVTVLDQTASIADRAQKLIAATPGISLPELAGALGVSQPYAYKLKKRYGV